MDNQTNDKHKPTITLSKELIDLFSIKSLKSTTRLSLLLILSLNTRMSFTDLVKSTGIGKGSLKNHLDILEEEGYIKSKEVFTIKGPRLIYEITVEGELIYKRFLDALSQNSGTV